MTNTPPATPEATTLRMSLFNVRSLSNKTFILNDFISSENLDLMFLTETWLQGADCNQLVELCPPHYECFNQPRVSGRGGGLVCVYKKSFKCHLLHFNGFSSFEALTFKLAGSYPILFALIYRPPKSASSFLAEFPEFLSSLVLNFEETILHAFISSRLDYCNSLFTCLNQKSLDRLQSVQNSAARLLTRTKKREHITPVLASLHWLPVLFRIDFKILLITFKALNGFSPAYITDLLSVYTSARTLRSSDKGFLAVPGARLMTKGEKAFSVRAPRLWNDLPEDIRSASSVLCFKSLLKTHFYRKAFPDFI